MRDRQFDFPAVLASLAGNAVTRVWSNVENANLKIHLVHVLENVCMFSREVGKRAKKAETRDQLDFQVENQPRAAYIGRTALVCVEECA